MGNNELKRQIYARIDELPALPVAVARLISLLDDPEVDVPQVTQVIGQDPALTAKLLQVANSAYYGFSGDISTIDRAVALLGLNMVGSLALSIGLVANLPKDDGKGLISQYGLWKHSVTVAMACRELSQHIGPHGGDEHMFIVGLLHDVGKILLLHFFAEQFEQALTLTGQKQNQPLYMSERQVIGLDHGQVGAMLLKRWKFPRQVVAPILGHHLHSGAPPDLSRDVSLIRVANALAQQVEVGLDGNQTPLPVEPSDLETLGITPADLLIVEQFVRNSEDAIDNFLSATT